MTNPKKILHEYFDFLRRQIDIYSEEMLDEYTDKDQHAIKFDRREFERVKNKAFSTNNKDYETIDLNSVESISQLDPYSKYLFWHKEDLFVWNDENLDPNPNPEQETINFHEYANKKRQEIMNELENAKNDALKYYETIKSDFNTDMSSNEMESILFAKKFYFTIALNKNCEKMAGKSPFQLYLVQLDFYLNFEERNILGYFI